MIYNLLAIPQAVTDNLKYIFIGVCAFAGVIALICGLVRGFYRTSRRWIKFAAVLAAFFFAYAKFAEKINSDKIGVLKSIPSALQGFAVAVAFLLAAIVAVNIVFGIIDAIVKHCAIKKMKRGVTMSRNPNPKKRKIEQRRIDRRWKPNAFSRICGGVACVLNVAACLGFIFGLALFVCSRFPVLADDKLAGIYSALPEKLLPFLAKYALDGLAVLVIVSISYCGYRAGALNGARAILMTFGILAAVLFGMFLPFSAWAGTGENAKAVGVPVRALSNWYKGFFERSETLAKRATLFSRLAAGLTLSLLFVLVIVLFGVLLKAITRTIRRAAVIRIIDGTLCFVVTFALALALVAVIATVLHTLDYVDVFKGKFSFASMFSEQSPLNSTMKKAFDEWLAPLLEEAKNAVKGYMPN